jgi:hypothetical protein
MVVLPQPVTSRDRRCHTRAAEARRITILPLLALQPAAAALGITRHRSVVQLLERRTLAAVAARPVLAGLA